MSLVPSHMHICIEVVTQTITRAGNFVGSLQVVRSHSSFSSLRSTCSRSAFVLFCGVSGSQVPLLDLRLHLISATAMIILGLDTRRLLTTGRGRITQSDSWSWISYSSAYPSPLYPISTLLSLYSSSSGHPFNKLEPASNSWKLLCNRSHGF